MPINFEGDQDHHDRQPKEYRDHLTAAIAHMAGYGPDPGKYKGPPLVEPEEEHDEPTEADLAAQRFEETGPAPALQPQPPTPAQETVQQPPQQKGKKTGAKSPTKGTPAELGARITQGSTADRPNRKNE